MRGSELIVSTGCDGLEFDAVFRLASEGNAVFIQRTPADESGGRNEKKQNMYPRMCSCREVCYPKGACYRACFTYGSLFDTGSAPVALKRLVGRVV